MRVIDRGGVEYLYELDDMRVATRSPALRCPTCAGRLYCYSVLKGKGDFKLVICTCICHSNIGSQQDVESGVKICNTARIAVVRNGLVSGYIGNEVSMPESRTFVVSLPACSNESRIVVQSQANELLT